jgi:hypothetical protein
VQPDPLALLHEPEGRVADSGRADEPLDVGFGQEGVETSRLRPGYDERLLFPVPAEKVFGRYRVDRFR